MRAPARLSAALTASALAATLVTTPLAGPAGADPRPLVGEPQPRHSSDGLPGATAAQRSAPARWRPARSDVESARVAPGVAYSAWTTRSDPARDPMRVHLLEVDLARARVDLLSGTPVRRRQSVRRMVEADRAVAGVNGDFFDIGDTGAPLGGSVDRQQRMRTARAADWTRGFWIGADGIPRIGRMSLRGSLVQRPKVRIRHLNSPTVWPGRIGAYTPDWGTTVGARVTDGRTRQVREVVIERGRVVSNRTRLSSGRAIRGRVLIGRGAGADRLRTLRRGQRITTSWHLDKRPRIAIGGESFLLRGGRVLASDDAALHPRTALGIDRDTGHLLLLVVDGRSESSAGATMVELARLLRAQGAEDALNLDGGGSSTMVGRLPETGMQVLNDPSDGQQRRVPNGLGVFARTR